MRIPARPAAVLGAFALTVTVAATLTAGSAVAPPEPRIEASLAVISPASVSRVEPPVSPRAVRPSRAVAQRTVRAARQAEFARFTLASPRTRDMRGIEPSLYRGRFFHRSTETLRLCVIQRESLGYYDVVSPSGSYRGAYQVSRPLARGVTWMMLKEHRALLGTDAAKRLMARLRSQPMNTWPRYWQDAAFFTVINWEGLHSGRQHWAGGRTRC